MNMVENFWSAFAKRINGELNDGKFDASEKVILDADGWKISFDHFTLWSGNHRERLTRITLPYCCTDAFKFEIYNQNILSYLAKIVGMQDIEIGDEVLDKRFILKSNDELLLKSMLWNTQVRKALDKLESLNLQTSDQKGIWEEDLPENERELSVYFKGEIYDEKVLLASSDLLVEIMRFLERSGLAKKLSPSAKIDDK